jgi:Fe-S-cluster containining protein
MKIYCTINVLLLDELFQCQPFAFRPMRNPIGPEMQSYFPAENKRDGRSPRLLDKKIGQDAKMASFYHRSKVLGLLLLRIIQFASLLFSRRGLMSREGRVFATGKIRRAALSCFPLLAMKLKKYYGLSGGCNGCGVSCNLMFRCPQWDPASRLCTIYENRPNVCRLFPITPSDIVERNLAASGGNCGYWFDVSIDDNQRAS